MTTNDDAEHVRPADVALRPATMTDRDAIIALVPRLRSFGDVPLRTPDELDRAERDTLERALASPEDDSLLVVAELEQLGVVGVAYARTETDYFSRERHGYLDVLVVAERGEGKGVGRALLRATERWAMQLGYRFMSLNVFAANERARAVYERAGYEPDTMRYFKELGAEERRGNRRNLLG